MRALLAVLVLLVAGCDTDGVDERGICLVGQQPAFDENDVEIELLAPTWGDTLRLGEPFRVRARVAAIGPNISRTDIRIAIFRGVRFESIAQSDVVYRLPLYTGQGIQETVIDRIVTIDSLRGGVTSASLGPDEYLSMGLSGEIAFPVESTGGPECGLTSSGTGRTRFYEVTVE